jgi:hypothetical protein
MYYIHAPTPLTSPYLRAERVLSVVAENFVFGSDTRIRTPGAPLNRPNSTILQPFLRAECHGRLILGDEAKDNRKEPPVTLTSQ